MIDLAELFSTSVPVLELVLRGTVMYLGILVLLRVIGQREAGGLGLTDVLLVVLVAEAAAVGIKGHAATITDGLILVTTILGWSLVLDALAYKWPHLGNIIKSRPRVLIQDGAINHAVRRRELMTHDELYAQLRLHGLEDPKEVERACIEPNGMISVVRRDHAEPEEPERPRAMH